MWRGGCPLAACLHEVWWWGLEGGGGVPYMCCPVLPGGAERGHESPHRRRRERGREQGWCSGKPPRYDKPSLKVG